MFIISRLYLLCSLTYYEAQLVSSLIIIESIWQYFMLEKVVVRMTHL